MSYTYEEIREQAKTAASELVETAKLKQGDILIVGCSSSEVVGLHIGKGSDINAAGAIYEGIQSVLQPKGIYLAAQCCEHLNRAVIVEKEALLPGTEIVNVVPQPHAGGSFAMTVYQNAKCPVAVEEIKADAGMDIGRTLIGMHLKKVAVPVRLSLDKIGEAVLICARTRPKFIGGSRAVYDDNLSGGDIPR
ncbi:MAG: TIGR01440 family protein [Firmicutes bacterium]|nr:TIGR01440 family protein [Bacillota bacterium]